MPNVIVHPPLIKPQSQPCQWHPLRVQRLWINPMSIDSITHPTPGCQTLQSARSQFGAGTRHHNFELSSDWMALPSRWMPHSTFAPPHRPERGSSPGFTRWVQTGVLQPIEG